MSFCGKIDELDSRPTSYVRPHYTRRRGHRAMGFQKIEANVNEVEKRKWINSLQQNAALICVGNRAPGTSGNAGVGRCADLVPRVAATIKRHGLENLNKAE
jgi:hypothetical protein